jgi:hypothetical protein
MPEFKQYSKDSEVVELYKVIEPRAIEADQWDGTLGVLLNLRRAISEGENYGDAFHSQLSNQEKTAAFDHIVQLMEQEIAEAKAGESEEAEPAEESSEEEETQSPDPTDA